MRVLVFPSCNEPGLEVIEALARHPRIEVLGGASVPPTVDPSHLVLGDRHFVLPSLESGREAEFAASLEAFCAEQAIDMVFPTVDSVVAALAGRMESVTVVAPSPEIASWALSKSEVYARVGDIVSCARPFDEASMALPAFAKPDRGSGSRGARCLDSLAEVEAARSQGGLLVQEYLPGREFTVDCVGDAGGKLLAASVRERTALAGGIARSTRCVRHPELESAARRIAARVPIAGPWFAQFREDADGVPRLMEVNVRVGGSSGATRLAGVNIPLLAALSFSGVPVRAPRRVDTLDVVRKLDRRGNIDDYDLAIWDLDDTLVHAGGVPDPEVVAWLYRLWNRGKRQTLVTRNVNPRTLLKQARVPAEMFEEIVSTTDKVLAVRALLDRLGVSAERTIMLNDSGAEKLAFEEEIPAIRTFAPDAIGALAG